MSGIQNIRDRIFGKSQEWDVITIWDSLMAEYGFFPLEYLLSLDQEIVNQLIKRINKRRSEQNKQMKKGGKK